MALAGNFLRAWMVSGMVECQATLMVAHPLRSWIITEIRDAGSLRVGQRFVFLVIFEIVVAAKLTTVPVADFSRTRGLVLWKCNLRVVGVLPTRPYLQKNSSFRNRVGQWRHRM